MHSENREFGTACVHVPREASPAAGFDGWDIEMVSRIGTSDAILTLIFVTGKRVSYVVDLPRNEAEFAKLTLQCFSRSAAIFERIPSSGGIPEFVHTAGK